MIRDVLHSGFGYTLKWDRSFTIVKITIELETNLLVFVPKDRFDNFENDETFPLD